MKYFSYDHGLRMTNEAFDEFFGGPPRKPETWMAEREFDIAASIQKVCEEVVLRMVAPPAPRDRARPSCAWPAASRSTASPTAA